MPGVLVAGATGYLARFVVQAFKQKDVGRNSDEFWFFSV